MKKSLQLSMDLYYIGMILYIYDMKPCMILYIYGMKPYHICIKSYGVRLCLTGGGGGCRFQGVEAGRSFRIFSEKISTLT